MQSIKDLIHRWLQQREISYNVRVYVVLVALFCYICYIFLCTYDTFITHRAEYAKRVAKLSTVNKEVPPLRGVIFSEHGDMISASIPHYDVYFDFREVDDVVFVPRQDTVHGRLKKTMVRSTRLPQDTIDKYLTPNGTVAQVMHRLNSKKSGSAHVEGLRRAYRNRNRRYKALESISYLEYKYLTTHVPFFSKSRFTIGFQQEEHPFRYHPYGESSMAAATIGSVCVTDQYVTRHGTRFNKKGHGISGIEASFDSLLTGQSGKCIVREIRNKREREIIKEPVNGADVYTTLDMEMQSVLHNELSTRILQLGAEGGWAAVMETATGKIKAISNLKREGTRCREDYNHFVQDLYDPGSTFKTISYMVLLDDKQITKDSHIDTGNYPHDLHNWSYNGKDIRDDHPVGQVTADEALAQSSNIAFAKFTTRAYGNNPQRYLDLIAKTHIFDDLKLQREFSGAQRPRSRKVKDATWNKSSLAQISYGYETQIPGMYILNFYNAIANGGKLMRPYIVDRVEKDGEVILRQKPEVVNSKICSESTLKTLRHGLESVVEHGTAETKWNSLGVIYREGAKSKKLKIAGKTGTAQRYDARRHTYRGTGHYVSFAGYFPADDPQYTCLVVLDVRPGGNYGSPGGGYMAGPVFRNFAEQVYAKSCRRSLSALKPDSLGVATYGMNPRAKRGEIAVTEAIVRALGMQKQDCKMHGKPINFEAMKFTVMPDVTDLGATDALYMLERLGLQVECKGRGRVVEQSLPVGSSLIKGKKVTLVLK